MIEAGSPAPDFELESDAGERVRLSSLRGRPVVLYFYPRDDTPGCTAQACSFRDQFEVFKDAGAEVVGVSDDSPRRHKEFAARHNLPFTLLSDRGGGLRKRLGVPRSMGIIPGRVTYIIDKDGVVRGVFNSQTQAEKHIDEALAVLKR